MSNTVVIRTEAEFRDLFWTRPNVGPMGHLAAPSCELRQAHSHAIGPNGKTACGLPSPKAGSVAMEAWIDASLGNYRAAWTVR